MGEKQIVYDNFPDMKIKLQDGRIVTLGELEPMVMAAGKLFAYAPWSTSKNPRPTRILAFDIGRPAWRCSISKPEFHIGGHRENRVEWISASSRSCSRGYANERLRI